MISYNVVILLGDEHKWKQMLGRIGNLKKNVGMIDKIAVVVVDTAILSCLVSGNDAAFKEHISELCSDGVEIKLCGNTAGRYGFTQSMILPQISIVAEGGLLTVIRYKERGFHLFEML